jgi:8-hydroxy-5-deazaflavin:NADPH oxidoreductase
MATVGFVGSGRIGSTVARLSVGAGHQVVLSNSRGAATLADLAAELGPLARAASGEEAAQEGDLVVIAVPFGAYRSLPAGPLAGKLVLDACNYSPGRDRQIAVLDDGVETSSELLAHQLAGASVVKVFNNIFFRHLLWLARPAGAADRSYLPIAGDDPAAKAAVSQYLDSIGFGAVDAGNLADSWRQEPGQPAYGPPYGPLSEEQGQPASEADIRDALSRASR